MKGEIIMNGSEVREHYYLHVYNSMNDYPLAISNIEDFSFDILLGHSSSDVKKFNFIVIFKCTENGNTTTVKPSIIIYDNNAWSVNVLPVEDIYKNSRMMTHCYNGKESLDFNGELDLFPCNNQVEIMEIFDRESEKIIYSKTKRKSLFRNRKKA